VAVRLTDIEAWALAVIERVEKGHPIEDARVELKAAFPSESVGWKKWARRIAGHANAARGEPVLWLVGVNERRQSVPGTEASDAAVWWPRVRRHFDGVAPRLVDLAVPHGDVTVMALWFETDRAPFVVKNPDGGAISFEVPWRDGTAVRSARREDLVRLLVPQARLPRVEVLQAATDPAIAAGRLGFVLTLYLTPANGEAVTLPVHRASVECALGDCVFELEDVQFDPGHLPPSRRSPSVEVTASEAVATGPGRVLLRARSAIPRELPVGPCSLTVKLGVAGADAAVVLALAFEAVVKDERGASLRWREPTARGR
jgi:hypothetical protein